MRHLIILSAIMTILIIALTKRTLFNNKKHWFTDKNITLGVAIMLAIYLYVNEILKLASG